MKGKIIQSGKLYLQKEGEDKIRHIKNWEVYEKICKELGISTNYDERTFVEELPLIGRPITEWPEEEEEYKVGPERLVWCVPLECDFQDIVDAGFTAIHTYGQYWTPNHGRDFLDKAQAHGLKVLFSTKTHVHDLLRNGQSWDKSTCKWMVGEFDSHPALWAWIYFDEADAGDDNPSHLVSMNVQKEIHDCFREWTDKPLTTVVRGGTRGWNLVDLDLFDFIMADTYAIDGNEWIWEPNLTWKGALDMVGEQERKYLNANLPDKPMMFIFQSSDAAAIAIGNDNTRIPEGKIQAQFDILNKYGLFSFGVGMYPWSGGDFDPMGKEELRLEIKEFFEKIK